MEHHDSVAELHAALLRPPRPGLRQPGAVQQRSPAPPPLPPLPPLPPPPAADPRISGLGPRLSEAELHGGWRLTQEVYDRASHHPNATVVSWSRPRVVTVAGFLSPHEVMHLKALAEGGFARSEVVADGASRLHEAR